jgi:hypothetical protein
MRGLQKLYFGIADTTPSRSLCGLSRCNRGGGVCRGDIVAVTDDRPVPLPYFVSPGRSLSIKQGVPTPLFPIALPNCQVNRLFQLPWLERLQQICDTADIKGLSPEELVLRARHEYYRERKAARCQMTAQFHA